MATSGAQNGEAARDADRAGADSPNPGSPGRSAVNRALTALGLLTLMASALFGGNVLGVRERFLGSETPTLRPAAGGRAALGAQGSTPASQPPNDPASQPPKDTVLASQPWWQAVATPKGVGSMATPELTVDQGALQWRVRWTCSAGRLLVRAPGQARAVVNESCPGTGTGYGSRTGSFNLQVTTDGPWQMELEQQVDVPLDEPPLPAMTAPGAAAVTTGSLYRVDQVGTGTVTLYRLADRTYALRLDDFFVTANSDLELQLSTLEEPRSTEQVSTTRSATIAFLDVTAGSLNFALPPGLDPTGYRSLVIWCERTSNAYAAASLKPA